MEKIQEFESNIKNEDTKESQKHVKNIEIQGTKKIQNFAKISRFEVPEMSRKQRPL